MTKKTGTVSSLMRKLRHSWRVAEAGCESPGHAFFTMKPLSLLQMEVNVASRGGIGGTQSQGKWDRGHRTGNPGKGPTSGALSLTEVCPL